MARQMAMPQEARNLLARWYTQEQLESATLLQGSLIGWLFGIFGQAAVTVNGTVHLTPRAPDLGSTYGKVILGHEYYHVLQQREMGWWNFLAQYVWSWRPYHVTQGWKHPLEAPAYARGEEVRVALES